MEKFIGHFIVACLLFLAGYALLYGWNWLSDNITPKWMKAFMVFDRAKEFFVFEATRRFNIIGIIIVLVTRWVFYFLLTFIPMNYLMEKLYKPEMGVTRDCPLLHFVPCYTAEIEARRKQYEYYREKLLTFKRKSA